MAKEKKDSFDSFEKLFSELEETVAKLEKGDLSLDESLALFQRGTELAKKCGEMLDRAQLRVKELAPRGEEVGVDEFEEEEDGDAE
jgi:exodeoxyribonuclease VII small subunit